MIIAGPPGAPGLVIARGAVNDTGTLTPNDSDTDNLRLPRRHLVHRRNRHHNVSTPAPPTCLARFSTTGAYTIVGGTGRFRHAAGSGTSIDYGIELTNQSSAGCINPSLSSTTKPNFAEHSPLEQRERGPGKRGIGAWSTSIRTWAWVCAREVRMRGKEHDNPALPLLALPNHLMTMPEVAAYLNEPVRWIEDAVQRRRVRHTRIGKRVRFALEHVAELIAAGEQPVTRTSRQSSWQDGTRQVEPHGRRRPTSR